MGETIHIIIMTIIMNFMMDNFFSFFFFIELQITWDTHLHLVTIAILSLLTSPNITTRNVILIGAIKAV